MPRGRLFVGKLDKQVRKSDLEDIFQQYGNLTRLELKFGAELGYAFVDYEDERDAEDCLRKEDGRLLYDRRIHIEWVKNRPRGYGGNRIDYRDAENVGKFGERRRQITLEMRNTGHNGRRSRSGSRERHRPNYRSRQRRSRSREYPSRGYVSSRNGTGYRQRSVSPRSSPEH